MYTYDRYIEVEETPTAKQRSVYLCMEVKTILATHCIVESKEVKYFERSKKIKNPSK